MVFSPVEPPASTTDFTNGNSTGWELALVTAPSSNESAAANSKLVNSLSHSLPSFCYVQPQKLCVYDIRFLPVSSFY